MTAGLHMKSDIIAITYSSDDDTGGAIITGSVAYNSLPSILTARRSSQRMLEAGLETDTVYDFTCAAKFQRERVIINERDEVQVTWPLNHALFGLKFRVTGVQVGSSRISYAPLHCTLSRIVSSRSQQ